MKHALERLRDVRGLYASAFFDGKGETLASHGAHPAFTNMLVTSGPHLVQALAPGVRRRAPGWETSILRFERGTLLIGRREDTTLVLWGTSTIDVNAAGAALRTALATRSIGAMPGASEHKAPISSRTFAVEEAIGEDALLHISKR